MSRPFKSTKQQPRQFHEIFYQEYWIITHIGTTYAFKHTPAWAAFAIISYLVTYTILLMGLTVLAYTCFLIKDHTALLCQTIYFLIVTLIVVSASLSLTLVRSKIHQLREFFDDQYTVEFARNEYFDGLLKETNRKKYIHILMWASLYGTCGSMGLNQPLIDSLSSRSFPSSYVNGVWTNLPVPIWFPLDVDGSNESWWLAFSFEAIFLVVCAFVVTSAIMLFFSTADKLLDQIKLAIYGIENLNLRAKVLFRRRYPGRKPSELKGAFDDCYYDCIAESVKHHHHILDLMDKFMDIANISVSVPFYGGAILLGMAMITVTSENDVRLGSKWLGASVAFTSCYNMYLACSYGQNFIDLSIKLHDALFFARWYERSRRCMKAIIIMRYGCSRPITFSAGKLIILNMERFADVIFNRSQQRGLSKLLDDLHPFKVMNSAYSLFNLNAVRNN